MRAIFVVALAALIKAGHAEPAPVAAPTGLYSFTLTQTPLHQVVQVLYGEILREPYLLDDVVKNNTVSINFKNADPKALRDVLDAYLRTKGVARVQEQGVNLFVPADKAVKPEANDGSASISEGLASKLDGGFQRLTQHPQRADLGLDPGESAVLYRPKFRQAAELLKLAQQIGNKSAQIGDDILLIGRPASVTVARVLLEQFDTASSEIVVRVSVAEFTASADDGAGIFGALKLLGSRLNLSIGDSKPLANFVSFKTASVEAVLSAFAGDSRFNVLDTSTIRILSGKSGRLSIGQEVPVLGSFTQSNTGQVVQNVNYRNAGLQLEVKPVVVGDRVQAEVTQVVSSFAVTRTSNIDSPTLLKREFSSVLGADFGEVIVLGGLDEDRATEASSSFLSLPLGKNKTRNKSSLFLVLQFQRT